MTRTHLIALVLALLFLTQVEAGESKSNNFNLVTLSDPNITSCSVDKTRTHPYVAKVELKVSETASRQYVFFENGEGMVTLEDGTITSLSVKETAAFFGYSEKTFARDPRAHILLAAESWTGIPGVLSITASIDSQLLDLIDQYAPNYFNPLWNMNINQYKVWIATIAWAEGGIGGYGAHSGWVNPTNPYISDVFYHVAKGSLFQFSTGIGPFQLDNGSTENWQRWVTKEKIDPEKAVLSVLNWHRQNRWNNGFTLADFAAIPHPPEPWPWCGLDTAGERAQWWGQVTGESNWLTHAYANVPIDWPAIRAVLAQRASAPSYRYSYNIESCGNIQWNIKATDNVKTETDRSVILDGLYPTWRIRSRMWGGGSNYPNERYYYTYRNDLGPYPIEVWVLDNSGEVDQFKYIFARECNGQYPELRVPGTNTAGHPILSSPAIITGDNYPVVNAFNVTPISVTLGNSFTISYTVSDDIGLQQTELWRANDVGGVPDPAWPNNPIVTTPLSGQTSYSGSFTDTPSSVGTYWYGMHVVDNAGNWNDERNSNTGGLPGVYGPIAVVVNPLRSCSECEPEDAYLGTVGTVVWGYSVSGNCGNGGKWVGQFVGEAGRTYHFDLCPDSPGSGTNSGFDPDIKITNSSCTILAGEDGACSSPSYSPNDFQWTCSSNGTYYVIIAPYSSYNSHTCGGNSGDTFMLKYYKAAAVVNDMFADAITISGTSGQTTGNNVGATKESGEPSHADNSGGASVWWYWTAPATGQMTIDTFGSSFDTLLAVYTGSSVGSLTPIDSNDDFGSLQSQVTFTAVSGTTYRIAVDGYGGVTGNIILNWSLIPSDTTPPTVTITSPTSNPTYSTSSSPLNIGGTASDNVGVVLVAWANNRGGSGPATGTTSWSANGITLYSGDNVITVTAYDVAGNTGSDTLTVTYTLPTCDCTSWQNVGCGQGGCSEMQMYQTRTCTPSGCDQESRCVYDASCSPNWKSPTATGKADNGWVNPSNAYTSNDQYTTAEGQYKSQDYYNFNFDVPIDSVIDGIEVAVEGHGDPEYTNPKIIVDIYSNSAGGWGVKNNGTGGWWVLGDFGVDAVATGGGSSDLWGKIWTVSDFSNNNFLLRLKTFSYPDIIYVDSVLAKVYYHVTPACFVTTPTPPSGTSGGQICQNLNFSTSGSTCSNSHAVEYRFDWGDNSGYSSWDSATQSHTYSSANTYTVKAQARCASTFTESLWSDETSVIISQEQILPSPMTADLNNDGIPNFYDFSYFAMFWRNTSCSCPNWCNGSDFDRNGIVDIYDLQIFAEFWLWPVADVDMDGKVNFTDYVSFSANWEQMTCESPDWCYGCDFDKSGTVDILDFAVFADYWLEGQ